MDVLKVFSEHIKEMLKKTKEKGMEYGEVYANLTVYFPIKTPIILFLGANLSWDGVRRYLGIKENLLYFLKLYEAEAAFSLYYPVGTGGTEWNAWVDAVRLSLEASPFFTEFYCKEPVYQEKEQVCFVPITAKFAYPYLEKEAPV